MMNNEELERKIEFIVNQQAQFVIDIDLLRENLSQVSNTVSQMSVNVTQVNGSLVQATEVVTRLARVTHEGFTQVNAKIDALVDAQIRTEDNLQKLIRSLTKRSNGNNA